jgi:peroxiredoxin family protein
MFENDNQEPTSDSNQVVTKEDNINQTGMKFFNKINTVEEVKLKISICGTLNQIMGLRDDFLMTNFLGWYSSVKKKLASVS